MYTYNTMQNCRAAARARAQRCTCGSRVRQIMCVATPNSEVPKSRRQIVSAVCTSTRTPLWHPEHVPICSKMSSYPTFGPCCQTYTSKQIKPDKRCM